MITSLSMCSNKVASSLIVACGMESGDLYLHDCRYLATIHSTGQKSDIHLSEKVQKGDALAIKTPCGHPSTPPTTGMSLLSQSLAGLSAEQKQDARQFDYKAPVTFVSLKLSSEPILTVDLTTSGSNEADESGFHSILAISGCAGMVQTVKAIPQKARGLLSRLHFIQKVHVTLLPN